MLEVLLMQYADIFGEDFPLANFAGTAEIEVINIIYECVHTNTKYTPGMTVDTNRFPEAPKK